jgi:hypothetical protein
MKAIITTFFTIFSLAIFAQTDRFVELYNKGLITTTELENLIIANQFKSDTTEIITLINTKEHNQILYEFSQNQYGVSAINPAIWKYLKDFWNFATKSLFKNPSCDNQLKDCKELIAEINRINASIGK